METAQPLNSTLNDALVVAHTSFQLPTLFLSHFLTSMFLFSPRILHLALALPLLSSTFTPSLSILPL